MNLSLILSGGIHILVFALLVLVMQPGMHQKTKATYTIDFIGSAEAKPTRYAEAEKPAAAPPAKKEEAAEVKQPESDIKVAQKKPEPKTKKPVYNSKEEITKTSKANKKKTETKAAEPAEKKEEKVTLSKPSILAEVQSSNISASDLHSLTASEDPNNTVRASFTNFPYPWYITQVRNALWREWSKRMPKNSGDLATTVSFNIDKYGAVYGVQIENTSGNDSYDYAATSAANNSAPYPPLPQDFGKDILTVTVEFKNEK